MGRMVLLEGVVKLSLRMRMKMINLSMIEKAKGILEIVKD